jgi:hypothetical protein
MIPIQILVWKICFNSHIYFKLNIPNQNYNDKYVIILIFGIFSGLFIYRMNQIYYLITIKYQLMFLTN